jgi:hypothetical protein
MLAEIREHLEAQGIDPACLDNFQTPETEVEVDALTEAIDELSKAMKKDDKPSKKPAQASLFDDEDMDDEDMDDEDMDEDDTEDAMDKGGMMYRDAMKALAEGTDEVVSAMEKRLGAIAKGLEAVLKEMKAMKFSNDEMNKSLTKSLNTTSAPRAVTTAPAPVAPVAPAGPSRNDLIKKGLKSLQNNALTSHQRANVRTAIAQLEAGVPVANVSHLIDLD